jgi:hypothetical protein
MESEVAKFELTLLGEKYGEALLKELLQSISSSSKLGEDYVIDVEDDPKANIASIYFSTTAYGYIFMISKKHKRIMFTDRIGRVQAHKLLELMKSLEGERVI